MKLIDFFVEHNIPLDLRLADILIFGVEHVFPTCYSSGKEKNWSNWKIVDYVSKLDISDEDLDTLISVSKRVLKMKAFL